MSKQTLPKQSGRNQLRIIGGKWRGRKISFPDVEGLRPTADRIRETVFNWLAPHIEGARCLDLFAGSGAMGFEALSRDADDVVLVDTDSEAIKHLRRNSEILGDPRPHIYQQRAEDFRATDPSYDIVFLDPPFAYSDLDQLLQSLEQHLPLAPGAWIYLESAVNRAIVAPQHWRLHRHKQAGQVAYRLFQRDTANQITATGERE